MVPIIYIMLLPCSLYAVVHDVMAYVHQRVIVVLMDI